MIEWLIIIGLVIIAFSFLRMRHLKHKTYAIFIIVIIAFVYLSVTKVVKDNNIDLSSFNGIVSAGKVYFVWLGHVFSNLAHISGNAVNMNWFGNLTNLTHSLQPK